MREKTVFVISLLSAAACIAFSSYLKLRQSELESGLARHGFDRTFVVELVRDNSSSSGADASEFIANAPSVTDGLRTVFSRASAIGLSQLADVDVALPVAKSIRQLNLASGLTSQVFIYNITPQFLESFALGNASELKPGVYVPSPQLRQRLKLPDASLHATLGVADSVVEKLPSEMRSAIDWSKAKHPMTLSAAAFGTAASASPFADAIFTTGTEPKISIPGLFLFPKFTVFIKLKSDADLDLATARLQQFIAGASAADRKAHLQFAPLSSFFAEQLGLSYIDRWGIRIQQGLVVLTVLLFLMLALVRHNQMRREIALRRAVGTPLGWAVWLSGRSIAVAITGGATVACIAGSAAVSLAGNHASASLLPTVSAIYLAAAVALVALGTLSVRAGKMDLAIQLKQE